MWEKCSCSAFTLFFKCVRASVMRQYRVSLHIVLELYCSGIGFKHWVQPRVNWLRRSGGCGCEGPVTFIAECRYCSHFLRFFAPSCRKVVSLPFKTAGHPLALIGKCKHWPNLLHNANQETLLYSIVWNTYIP
jgi:hypothetical protein